MEVLKKFLDMLGAQGESILIIAISFLILVWILNKFLFKPLMAHMDARSKEIEGTFKKIDADRAEIERLMAEYQNRMAKIEKEAYDAMQAAIKEGIAAKTEIIDQAHAASAQIIAKAQAEIQLEKEKALVELRSEIVNLALAAAEKVVARRMDESIHADLVRKFLDEVEMERQTQKAH